MSRHRPQFVTLAPGDSGSTISPTFFLHPDTTFPAWRDKNAKDEFGNVWFWGTPDQEWEDEQGEDGQIQAMTQRMMCGNMMYRGGMEKPEVQFINRLIEHKQAALLANTPQAKPFYSRDFVIDLDMITYPTCYFEVKTPGSPTEQERLAAVRTSPRVWRRLVVSGGISLRALHHMALVPGMGFSSNCHAYYFTDLSDGSVFGPPEGSFLDLMHISNRGVHKMAPDDQVCLADIISKEGAQMGWEYDFGDAFSHMITIIEIKSKEESTGKIQCIDGAKAGPPEDSAGYLDDFTRGGRGYEEFLQELAKHRPGGRTWSKMVHKVHQEGALNYTTKPYHPDDAFSPQAAQADIMAAIRSPGKVPEAAQPTMATIPGLPYPVRVFNGAGWNDPSGKGPDNGEKGVCGNCGCPNHLMTCARCGVRKYCSRECQKAGWRYHKGECKER
jgi:hypothetical protein